MCMHCNSQNMCMQLTKEMYALQLTKQVYALQLAKQVYAADCNSPNMCMHCNSQNRCMQCNSQNMCMQCNSQNKCMQHVLYLVSCAAVIQHHVKAVDFLSEVLVVPCFRQAFPQQARWPRAAAFSNKKSSNFTSKDQIPKHDVNDTDHFNVEAQAITMMQVLQAVAAGDLVVPGTNHGSSDYYT